MPQQRKAHNDLSSYPEKIQDRYKAIPIPPQKFVRYHPEIAPEGRVFQSPEIPAGWYDTPAKFPGANTVTATPEQGKVEVPAKPVELEEMTDERLAVVYEAAFGRRPHAKAKRETIIEALKAA